MSPYRGGGGPYAVAHRGGAGLAAENTLEAFAMAFGLGFRYLETDVRATSDGVGVAFHDATLRRVTGSPGRLSDRSWRDLDRVRVAGRHPIPRLEDLLTGFPTVRFTIDLKTGSAIPPLVKAVRSCRAVDRVCVAGSADRWLAAVRAELGPGLATALGWESLARLALAARTGTRPRRVVPAPFAHVPLRLGRIPVFGGRFVSMAQELGIQVLVWTVDDPPMMHRLLDAGVDGIITDRPDLLREVLIARGAWGRSAGSRSAAPG